MGNEFYTHCNFEFLAQLLAHHEHPTNIYWRNKYSMNIIQDMYGPSYSCKKMFHNYSVTYSVESHGNTF